MTPYTETFFPIFAMGCAIAFVCSIAAARISGCALPALLLAVGVVAFWAALFIGSDTGYRNWQRMPNPPPEAFNDSAPVGALLAGWLPGAIFCGLVFGLVRLVCPKPAARLTESRSTKSATSYEESANPYRKPESKDHWDNG